MALTVTLVSAEEEVRRVLPVVRALSSAGVPLSIDTRNAATARAASPISFQMPQWIATVRQPARCACASAKDRSSWPAAWASRRRPSTGS